jgi:hypothetical protein
MKFENKNQKGELKMENENQKLSFKDVFKIKDEICVSNIDCDTCPFYKKGTYTCIVRGENITQYVDEIEAICTEWESKKPTLAEKINEILKPYGMRLGAGNYICFEDENEVAHAKAELIDKLYTTKWKGELNE